jgi:hypothetical protein
LHRVFCLFLRNGTSLSPVNTYVLTETGACFAMQDEKQLAVFAANKRQQREQVVRRELSHQQQWQDDKRLQQQQKQQNRRSGASDNMKMAPSPV